jgi:hypothetical protein
MSSLPKEYNVVEPIEPFKKVVVNNLVSCSPTNSGTYTQFQQIEVDLPQSNWLNPASLSLNYKLLVNTSSNAGGTFLIGCPAYSPFSRVEVLADGAVIETINNYNVICQMILSGTMDVAQKAGNAGYGYLSNALMTTWDNRSFSANIVDASANSTLYLSVPVLATILTNTNKNLPLFCMPKMTIRFTMANTNDITIVNSSVDIGTFTKFEVSQFSLTYESSSLGTDVESLIKKSSPKIKSFGYTSTSNTVLAGSNNTQQIVFNAKYSSLKGAFLLCGRGNGTGCKSFEFSDITNGNGEYQFKIGNNSAYPQSALSTTYKNASIVNEFKRAIQHIYNSDGKSLSINGTEYGITINTLVASLEFYNPGKFIPSYAFNGENTLMDPLTAVIQMNTPTLINTNVALVVCYDSVLVIDPINKKLTIQK